MLGATEIGAELKKYAIKSATERRSVFLVYSIKRKKKRVNSDMRPMKYDLSNGGYEIIVLITHEGDSFTLPCVLHYFSYRLTMPRPACSYGSV